MIQYKESELLLRFQTHNKENSKRFIETLNSLAKSKNLHFLVEKIAKKLGFIYHPLRYNSQMLFHV